ncbi:hypothetical protein Q5P01_003125 [Channa striata]|uniref:Ig-like domain-containing protein n=1 Tax=Channa striata TaxID=64152 RepID=A0AA88NRR8_CHASR|nr:hypothetical protein Q5P01_003125 [Channa striata]
MLSLDTANHRSLKKQWFLVIFSSSSLHFESVQGVSVLLLSGLTVSAVSMNVSPNLQQFFEGNPVSLSCVEDGQTGSVTVKRTRGGQTEECETSASSFGRWNGSSCTIQHPISSDSAVYWCETSSGQKSDTVTITVTDKDLILEIPALPVVRGSDVTLRCRKKNGGTVAANFFRNRTSVTDSKTKPEFTVRDVQQSDEGFYHCSTDRTDARQSWLRVTDPPPPPPTTTSHPPTKTTNVKSPFTSPSSPPLPTSNTPPPHPPCVSVVRLFLILLIFCLFFISSALMLSICRSRRTGNKPSVSMEMTTHC